MMQQIGEFIGNFGIVSFLLFAAVVIWSTIWKIIALWKAARKKHLVWFIVLALVNTIGILEILYIYVFSEMKPKRKVRKRRR
jgi:hypothetical protein